MWNSLFYFAFLSSLDSAAFNYLRSLSLSLYIYISYLPHSLAFQFTLNSNNIRRATDTIQFISLETNIKSFSSVSSPTPHQYAEKEFLSISSVSLIRRDIHGFTHDMHNSTAYSSGFFLFLSSPFCYSLTLSDLQLAVRFGIAPHNVLSSFVTFSLLHPSLSTGLSPISCCLDVQVWIHSALIFILSITISFLPCLLLIP